MKTLYDVLEVSQSCTQEALDASYYRLAAEQKRLLNKNSANISEIQFRLDSLNSAYSTLSNPAKRMAYDRRIMITKSAPFESIDDSNGFLSLLVEIVKKPLIVVMMLALIPAFLYLALRHNVKKQEIVLHETISNKALDIVDSSVENTQKLQKEKLALENERLQQELELLKMEQQRRDRQLEYERERQAQQIELLQQEQDRNNRRLEYEANIGNRKLNMEERKLDITEREIGANRKTIDAHNNAVSVQNNVDEIYRTIDIQRDAAAAKLGITRQQYDQILSEKHRRH